MSSVSALGRHGFVRTDDIGAKGSANVPRPSGSSLISLHPSPQRHRPPAMWVRTHDYPMRSTVLADSGRRSTQRSGIKEEPEGRGTAAELSATPT